MIETDFSEKACTKKSVSMAERKRPPPLHIDSANEPAFLYEKLKKLGVDTHQLKSVYQRLEKTIEKLQFMNISHVLELFEYTEKTHIEYEHVFNPDREVIRIVKPIEKSGQLFYKSTGTSRGDISIKGLWFPFTGKMYERFEKPEDKYINALLMFKSALMFEEIPPGDISLIKEMIHNPDIFECGRFIDKVNASISSSLYSKK